MNNSHRTALNRKQPSSPVKFLNQNNLLTGEVLDYGCGKGFDAKHYGYSSYDPYYQPEFPTQQFDTVYCCYVLNVLPTETERKSVLAKIAELLKNDGKAYIIVRNDKAELTGYKKNGTFQTYVELNGKIVKKNNLFIIYEFSKSELLGL